MSSAYNVLWIKYFPIIVTGLRSKILPANSHNNNGEHANAFKLHVVTSVMRSVPENEAAALQEDHSFKAALLKILLRHIPQPSDHTPCFQTN